jgi:hypothetical protein
MLKMVGLQQKYYISSYMNINLWKMTKVMQLLNNSVLKINFIY